MMPMTAARTPDVAALGYCAAGHSFNARDLRCANRNGGRPDLRFDGLGFRAVLSPFRT
jgi:hypothetical protein